MAEKGSRGVPRLRRDALKVIAGFPAAAAAVGAPAVHAQNWPSGTISLIVPFPPGGQADLAARPVADAMQRILVQRT